MHVGGGVCGTCCSHVPMPKQHAEQTSVGSFNLAGAWKTHLYDMNLYEAHRAAVKEGSPSPASRPVRLLSFHQLHRTSQLNLQVIVDSFNPCKSRISSRECFGALQTQTNI